MAKAKQIADQYNTLRSDMKSKTSEFAKEAANKKQSVLDALSGVEEADKVKELLHKAKVKLAQEFREKNKDLIAEYKKLGAEHRKNEAQFQKLFTEAKETLNEDLTEEDFKEAIMGKSEAEEQEKKVPQFEDKNHREKSDETWKIKTEKANIWNGKEYETKKVEVKINPEGDIKEYVSGVPSHLIGEQLFSRKALSRLGLFNRLPANMGVIEEMTGSKPGETNNEKYTDFYEKNIKNRLAGCWNPYDKEFDTVDKRMNCWLADGNYAYFNEIKWHGNDPHYDYFFSVCLLKN